LVSYGNNTLNQWRLAAAYVDKILKGTKPACVFRAKLAVDSGMKPATDSDLISAIPI
jgi:hypothetical protein